MPPNLPPHWRTMLPSDHLQTCHLDPHLETRTVIEAIIRDLTIATPRGKEQHTALKLSGLPYPLLLNISIGEMIAKHWGDDPAQWIGKPIFLVITQERVKGNVQAVIRVSTHKPKEAKP